MKVIKIFLHKFFNTDNPVALFVYFGPKETWCQYVPKLPKICNSTWQILSCDNWADLEQSLLRKPNALIIHYSELLNHNDNSIESIVNIAPFVSIKRKHKKLRLAVAIDQRTSRYFIIELFGLSFIKNLVPSVTDFGLIEYDTALTALLHKTYYFPRKIVDSLPAFVTTIKYTASVIISLTPRQNEIATMISKSQLSNKQIARVLGITESAVKFHLNKIFKKYNVSSRLQLSSALLKQK